MFGFCPFSGYDRDADEHKSNRLLVSQASSLISHLISGLVAPATFSCDRSDRLAARIWQPSRGVQCDLLVATPT